MHSLKDYRSSLLGPFPIHISAAHDIENFQKLGVIPVHPSVMLIVRL